MTVEEAAMLGRAVQEAVKSTWRTIHGTDADVHLNYGTLRRTSLPGATLFCRAIEDPNLGGQDKPQVRFQIEIASVGSDGDQTD